MSDSQLTCWTLIHAAADGAHDARQEYAERYAPVIRAYLSARWAGQPIATEIDDAVQEVFVECYRPGGALEKADPDRASGFRAFLFGLTRNVARRFEQRRTRNREQQRAEDSPPVDASGDDPLSVVFDRAWAKGVMRAARSEQARRAALAGNDAVLRVELLRLRFESGLPIREIAKRWCQDPTTVHREYAKARKEFQAAIYHELQFHGVTESNLPKECSELLGLLS